MSVIAKILIVLNLLLAVVFLGAAATFLGQQESYKVKLANLQTKYDTETKNLNESLTNARNDQRAQEALATQSKNQLTELQARFDQKEQDYNTLTSNHNTLLGQYERLSQTYKDMLEQNKQLSADKDRLLNEKETALTERRQAIDDMNAAVTEQKRLQGIIDDQKGQIAELNKRLNETAEKLETAQITIQAYQKAVGNLPDVINPPLIKAMVTGVDKDLNIVLISVGKDDQVKPGYSFTVYRGNEYVGKVMIDKVEKDYASGYSVKELEKEPIEVGDSATTGF